MTFYTTRAPLALVTLLPLLIGASDCDPEEPGPEMMPGEDCLECHDGVEATLFTAAGTVFDSNLGGVGLEGVTVTITDALGRQIMLESNAAGNFYTDAPIRMPFMAKTEYEGIENHMPDPQDYGGCNDCHRALNHLAPHSHLGDEGQP